MDKKTKSLLTVQNSKLLNQLKNVNYISINSEDYTVCILIFKFNNDKLNYDGFFYLNFMIYLEFNGIN